jgi:hypothetical protein
MFCWWRRPRRVEGGAAGGEREWSVRETVRETRWETAGERVGSRRREREREVRREVRSRGGEGEEGSEKEKEASRCLVWWERRRFLRAGGVGSGDRNRYRARK